MLDASTEIVGPYATKLLADAGADVVKVEPTGGDPLRRWTAAGIDLPEGEDSALFCFLNTSKRSILGEVAGLDDVLAGTDLLVDSSGPDGLDVAALRARHDHLVVLSISPFGLDGPWARRPATEFTLQAACGSTGVRGSSDRPPLAAGGRFGEWLAGATAAVAAMAAWRLARRTGQGDHVDLSVLECMSLGMNTFAPLFCELLGVPPPDTPAYRHIDHPSVEPTADGWVGFATIANQQFKDFLVLIERSDLLDDDGLVHIDDRTRRAAEFEAAVQAWTTRHTTEEIIRRASELRVPVAPVNDGASVVGHEQFEARGTFVEGPHGRQPRVPYLLGDREPPPFGPAPALGQDTGTVDWPARARPVGAVEEDALPLDGVRIVDLTTFWAGPSATVTLAALGADVVKVESIQRPDGMRFTSTKRPPAEDWWEWAPVFLGTSAGKRGVTLDLAGEEGRALALRLIEGADAVIENYSPRVLEQFGLDRDAVHAANPRAVLVRMPGFGLTGPWRDRTGYAPTMEQLTGLAWITGWPDGPPIVPRGPCDPLAGAHAAFALLVALEEREATGEGMLVEVPMVEAALQAAAGPIVEAAAYGVVQQRDGNHGPGADPQGVYPCAEHERWVALSATSEEHRAALHRLVGDDLDDEAVAAWTGTRPLDGVLGALLDAGIPAAEVVSPAAVGRNEQLAHRGFFEELDRPVVGPHHVPGLPYRFASRGDRPWHRRPAPTVGQHNDEVLGGELGLDADALERLRAAAVIGDAPLNA